MPPTSERAGSHGPGDYLQTGNAALSDEADGSCCDGLDLERSGVVGRAVAIILTFVAYKMVPRAPLVSSAASASIVALVLGVCCAVCAAVDLHTRQLSSLGVVYRRITTVTGAIALCAGLAGVLVSSGQALEILVVSTAVLWLAGTSWHVLSIGSEF